MCTLELIGLHKKILKYQIICFFVQYVYAIEMVRFARWLTIQEFVAKSHIPIHGCCGCLGKTLSE